MATSILLRSARSVRSSLRSKVSATTYVPASGAAAWPATPLSQRLWSLGSMARLFSTKPPGNDVIELGTVDSCVSVMEEENIENAERATGGIFTRKVSDSSDIGPKHIRGFSEVIRPSKYYSKRFLDWIPDPKLPVPPPIDWRKKGAVSPVKHQGGCACCWALGPVQAVEGLNYIKNLKDKNLPLVELSVQQVMDCATSDNACKGSDPRYAYRYMKNKGVCEEKYYPFTRRNQKCCQTRRPRVKISGFRKVPPHDWHALLHALSKQPLSASLSANFHLTSDYFQFKRGGIYYGHVGEIRPPRGALWHEVLIVGHGIEDGQRYLIIKESKGINWGENGYMRLAINIEHDGRKGIKWGPGRQFGLGDINGHVWYPVMKKSRTRKAQHTIKSSGGLSDKSQVLSTAEREMASDNKLGEKSSEGLSDTSIYSMEKSSSEYKDKIPEEVAKEIEDAISDLGQASAGEDVNEIKAKIGQHMSGGSGGDSSASSEGAKGGEQPPEAEYEEVKK